MKNTQNFPHLLVVKSSSQFSLTHEKAFVIDQTTAYIMSMNLSAQSKNSPDFTRMRDYGLSTTDPTIVKDVDKCF